MKLERIVFTFKPQKWMMLGQQRTVKVDSLIGCKNKVKPKQINGSGKVHFIARGKAHFALCQLSIELAHTDLIQKTFISNLLCSLLKRFLTFLNQVRKVLVVTMNIYTCLNAICMNGRTDITVPSQQKMNNRVVNDSKRHFSPELSFNFQY